jgi:DNA repair protein RadC
MEQANIVTQMCEHIAMIQSALETKIPEIDYSLDTITHAVKYLQNKLEQQEQIILLLLKHSNDEIKNEVLALSGLNVGTDSSNSSDCGGRERAIDHDNSKGREEIELF